MPAGRVRRADADRVDDPDRRTSNPDPGSRDPHPVTVRRRPAVRLRRGVHVRGRQPVGRAPGGGAVAGHRTARRVARSDRVARPSRPRRRRRDRTSVATSGSGPAGPGRRRRCRSIAIARPVDRGRDRRPLHRERCRRLAGWSASRPKGPAGLLRREHMVGGRRGHRPIARRGGCCRPDRGTRRFHRVGGRPPRGVAEPLRPHPGALHHRSGCGSIRPGPARGRRRTDPTVAGLQTDSRPVHRHHPRTWGTRVWGTRVRIWGTVVRRRGFAHPAAALTGCAPRSGGTGEHIGVRALPAGLAAVRKFCDRRRGRPGDGDRTTGRNSATGLGGRATDLRLTGPRLSAGDAR